MASLPRNHHENEPPYAELHSGDNMMRKEFHEAYGRMSEDFRAELIGGIVFVASPLKKSHARAHSRLSSAFDTYEGYTPGVENSDNATVILGDLDEVQPDLTLCIMPEYNGQTQTTIDDYISGAPELIAEIAHSSRSIDLNGKKARYAYAGVIEYIVVCLRPMKLHCFDLKTNTPLSIDNDGVFRSRVFPGLWLHEESLLKLDRKKFMEVIMQGIESAEHAAFVDALAGQSE